MRLDIPYGKTKLTIDIPDKNIAYVITDDMEKIGTDESEVISRAIESPISSKPLRELAKGRSRAVILASDITRPCPSYKFLPFLIDELKNAKVKDTSIILGLGIHRGHSLEEQKKLVGDYAMSECHVMDSDKDDCRHIGMTSFNTPVDLFTGALGADILIATGNIEYHYFAGYSGGAKAVMPGISSHASITNNHSYMLCEGACSANIKDNPVRADIEEAGRMAGIDYIFNVILDDDKRIIDAVSGSNDKAFLEGVSRYDGFFKKEVGQASDIVITSPGGFPKDINLYQSHKALENVKEIVRPGGEIILVAQCPEGFGEETFEKWMFKAKDYNRCKRDIEKRFVLGGHKAAAISKILSSAKVMLVSGSGSLPSEDIGFQKIDDLQSYLDSKIKRDGDLKITVVPSGRLVKLKDKESN